MQFKTTAEDGVTLAIAKLQDDQATKTLVALIGANSMYFDTEKSVQCQDGTIVVVKVGVDEDGGEPFLFTQYQESVIVHQCSASEPIGEGMAFSVLAAHSFAGVLELFASGHVHFNDFEALDDLIGALGMLDKTLTGNWVDTARLLEVAIEEAYNSGAIADYQYKHLAKRLSATAEA